MCQMMPYSAAHTGASLRASDGRQAV